MITNSWRVRKGVSVILFFLAIWRICILFSWFYFLVVQMSYCIMCMTHHTKYYTACYQLTTKRTKESLYCALCVVFRQSLLLLPSDQTTACIVIFNIPAWMLKATTRFFKINEWPTLLWKHTKTFTVDLSSGDFRCVRYAYTHKYILIHV